MSEMLMQRTEDALLARLDGHPDGDALAAGDATHPTASAGMQQIDGLLSRLPQTEYRVLEMLFGLDGSAPLTAGAVGAKLGLNSAAVRQLQASGLKRLRAMPVDGLDTTAN